MNNTITNTCLQLDSIANSVVLAEQYQVAAQHAAYILRELACALGDGTYPINRERLDATLTRIAGRTIGTHS